MNKSATLFLTAIAAMASIASASQSPVASTSRYCSYDPQPRLVTPGMGGTGYKPLPIKAKPAKRTAPTATRTQAHTSRPAAARTNTPHYSLRQMQDDIEAAWNLPPKQKAAEYARISAALTAYENGLLNRMHDIDARCLLLENRMGRLGIPLSEIQALDREWTMLQESLKQLGFMMDQCTRLRRMMR